MSGIEVQNTILGKYNYNGKDKIVCACEDFTDNEHILYEFESIALSYNPDKKIETEISDIMEVLDECKNMIDVEETKQKFWDMFIIDSIIDNTDRHGGNWGFILNKETGKTLFSKVYGCGSSLNPLYEDDELEKLSETEMKNLAINCYSCLKENGKKINYMSYIKEMNNDNCNKAIVRCFNNINIDKINNFINEIEGMSNIRKDFYKNIINIRYNIIKKVYNELI